MHLIVVEVLTELTIRHIKKPAVRNCSESRLAKNLVVRFENFDTLYLAEVRIRIKPQYTVRSHAVLRCNEAAPEHIEPINSDNHAISRWRQSA